VAAAEGEVSLVIAGWVKSLSRSSLRTAAEGAEKNIFFSISILSCAVIYSFAK
jgi:hypothetical protein